VLITGGAAGIGEATVISTTRFWSSRFMGKIQQR